MDSPGFMCSTVRSDSNGNQTWRTDELEGRGAKGWPGADGWTLTQSALERMSKPLPSGGQGGGVNGILPGRSAAWLLPLRSSC